MPDHRPHGFRFTKNACPPIPSGGIVTSMAKLYIPPPPPRTVADIPTGRVRRNKFFRSLTMAEKRGELGHAWGVWINGVRFGKLVFSLHVARGVTPEMLHARSRVAMRRKATARLSYNSALKLSGEVADRLQIGQRSGRLEGATAAKIESVCPTVRPTLGVSSSPSTMHVGLSTQHVTSGTYARDPSLRAEPRVLQQATARISAPLSLPKTSRNQRKPLTLDSFAKRPGGRPGKERLRLSDTDKQVIKVEAMRLAREFLAECGRRGGMKRTAKKSAASRESIKKATAARMAKRAGLAAPVRPPNE